MTVKNNEVCDERKMKFKIENAKVVTKRIFKIICGNYTQ
jgi:hypothetical protein